MVDRVSTASFHQTNLRSISNAFAEFADLNRQISSGKKHDSFTSLNGKVEQVSGYETQLKRNDSYISNNKNITTRLTAMGSSLEQLQDVASSFKSEISSSSALNTEANLAQNARATVSKVLDQLNLNVTGRYLFAGSKTDVPPVTNPPTNLTTGVADDNYYRGNQDVLSSRVSDNLNLEYGVTADDPAFQNLIAALNTAIEAGDNKDATLLAQAGDLIDEAIDGLAQVRARINSNTVIVQESSEQHERVKLVFQEALASEVDTDVAAVSIKLSANEVTLQATFAAFSRISGLNLVDFLR